MAATDFTIKSGDTQPVLTDTLTYSDGTAVNLTGATLVFVMRALSATAPVALIGTAAVTNALAGAVQYTFSAADTAQPGMYMANWVVTLSGGGQMTFPTVGYLSITVEQNLTAAGTQQLVSLPDAKDVLNIPAVDRSHDAKIIRFLQAVRPIVESLCGPIIPQNFDEWHHGGSTHIVLRRRPSTALGTSPLLTLIACSEYNGPVEWPLAIVASPDLGQLYSCMLDVRLAKVVRRTAGGGVQPFPCNGDGQDVHVVYQAGQNAVPANVYEGTLEVVRDFYQKTQQAGPAGWGRGSAGAEDEVPISAPMGFLIAGKVREWLGPMRRYPSLA